MTMLNTAALFLVIGACSGVPYLLEKRLRSGTHPHHLARPFAVALSFVLVLSIILSFWLGASLFLMALAIAIAFVTSALSAVCAVSSFMLFLFVRPWEYFPESVMLGLLPKTLAVLSLASFLFHAFRTRTLRLAWSAPLGAFLLLLIWLMVSVVFAPDSLQSFDYLFSRLFPSAVLFLLIIHSLKDSFDLRCFLSSLITAVTAVITLALIQTAATTPIGQVGGRLIGTGLLGNSNDLASIIVLVLPLVVYQLVERERSGVLPIELSRLFYGLSGVILLVGLWLTQSRGAFLALFVGGFAYIATSPRKGVTRWIVNGLFLVVPLLLVLTLFRASGDLDGSSSSRWNFIIAGINMTKQFPLFGVGAGNYPEMYELFTPAFDEWGNRTAHSSWILVMSEAGLPALLCFALLFGLVFVRCWDIRSRAPSFLVSFVAYGVTMSLLSHTYLFLPYVLFGTCIVASRSIRSNASSPQARRSPILGGGSLAPVRAAVLTLVFFAVFFPFARTALAGDRNHPRVSAVAYGEKPIGTTGPGMSSQISLSGSRGETLIFQIEADGCLRFPAEAEGMFPLTWFRMEQISTTKPSFPGAFVGAHYDPLIPISPVEEYCSRSVRRYLGELTIPNSSRSGKSTFQLSLGENKTLGIELTVWSMMIPQDRALPMYTEMSTWYNLLGHFGKWTAAEASLAAAYTKLVRDHRLELLTTHIDEPAVVQKQNKALLDLFGSPNREQSFYAMNLSGRPDWAYVGIPRKPYEDALTEASKRYYDAVGNTIRSGTLKHRPMVYLWDEPQAEDLGTLKAAATLVKKRSSDLRVMVTMPYDPEFHEVVDIFAPVAEEFGARGNPGLSTYRKLQKQGKEVWWYVSCMSHGCDALDDTGSPDLMIDRPSAYIRSIGWLAEKDGVDAFLYYFINYAYQFYPERDPWTDQYYFSGNGEGTLVYPGRPGMFGLERHTPLPSFRLKLLRESSFDAEYVRWMKELTNPPAWWNDELKKKFRSLQDWERDYSEYISLRQRMGDYLNQIVEAR